VTTKIDYEKVLNPSQLEAVMTVDGPILVIAGAGSGKTRTLTYRVARLVEQGFDPESILLLTFTRKASEEMLKRAAQLTDKRCRFVSGGTFHSLAHRVLKMHAGLLGFENSYTILDRSDMEEAIKSLVPELRLPKGAPRFPKRGTLASILSKAANLQQPVEVIMPEEYEQFLEYTPQMNQLSELYRDYKKANQFMDYDDLIIYFRDLLEGHPEVRRRLSQTYRFIMVDEYQDTNRIQADIVKWLGNDHTNVMVVGDDSQSIYSFRGADYRNMFDFSAAFPGAKVIKLEENYRSIQPILTFTNALMEQAGEKFTKCLFTKRKGGDLPEVVDTRTALEQARFVYEYITDQVNQGLPLNDFAVLFRAGYHSFELEAHLSREGIRYKKYGGFKFLESAHIKDFLAHMRVIINRDDVISWLRILKLVKNVGEGKSHAIIRWMNTNSVPPKHVDQWPKAGKKDTGLGALAQLLSRLAPSSVHPQKAIELVMDYYLPVLKDRFDDFPRRQKELEQLVTMAGRYKKLRSLLDDLVLEPPNSSSNLESGEKADCLTLSTIHSAKGLEWRVVFIIWVSEGRFPPLKAYQNHMALEEERRLLYVAATRAKNRLIICYPGREPLPVWQSWGGNSRNGLSSFIQDLPEEVLSYRSTRPTSYRPVFRQTEGILRDDDPEPVREKPTLYCQGDRVTHPAFGRGVVARMIHDDKVEVIFEKGGRKLLHLEYTILQKL
jgi:DNA helicase-2/ATP-dependent DNA helicase PcrA